MKKYILNFTPNGMIPTKDQTKYVPVSPEEIVGDVLEAKNLVHQLFIYMPVKKMEAQPGKNQYIKRSLTVFELLMVIQTTR